MNRREPILKGTCYDFDGLIDFKQAFFSRMKLILDENDFELVFVEMEPGDALFFDCNLLHSSDQNNSDMRRWVMISSFNKRRNNPKFEHHHPFYHPLEMLPNEEILKCDRMESTTDKAFMAHESDKSAIKNKDS